MSRKVYVSSDMGQDERLAAVAETDSTAALLWPWILTGFDDWGRCEFSPRRIKFALFPNNPGVDARTIESAIELYAEAGLVTIYSVNDHTYVAVPEEKWWKYQTHIRHSKREKDASRLPAPPADSDAHVRDSARDDAEPRDNARDCIPSPSPSPSPPIPPKGARKSARPRRDSTPTTPDDGSLPTVREPEWWDSGAPPGTPPTEQAARDA
jgi:hypothetical protein